MLSAGEDTHNLLGDVCENVHLALSHVTHNQHSPLLPIISYLGVWLPLLSHYYAAPSCCQTFCCAWSSVNLMHSGDPRGTGMSRQHSPECCSGSCCSQSSGALLDSCLWTLQGEVRGSCLFDHTVSAEKDTSSHLATSFIFSLEGRFPRCSSVFLEELARKPCVP